jgi:hypothetical protein
MPTLQNILLGVFVGRYLLFAQFDSIWWSHFGVSADSLKSKIPLTTRNGMASFYKSLHASPPNFEYFLGISSIILLLSFLGGIIQRKNPVQSALSLLTFATAIAVEIFLSRGIQGDLILKTSGTKPIEQLYWLSVYHGITFGLLIATSLLQISTDKEEIEEAKIVKAKKTQ